VGGPLSIALSPSADALAIGAIARSSSLAAQKHCLSRLGWQQAAPSANPSPQLSVTQRTAIPVPAFYEPNPWIFGGF